MMPANKELKRSYSISTAELPRKEITVD